MSQTKATPTPSMPAAETMLLREAYEAAGVILEYGSGGSTRLASRMPDKYILSIESDVVWARQLRQQIAQEGPLSPVTVYHVDIGPTGAWGRPCDESHWRSYHRYPNAIWDEPFFRHPDVVLIDGRFRLACLMSVILHTTRPVRVLFDDYADRPKYHRAERILRPERMVGRMAEFLVRPGVARSRDIGYMIAQFFDTTIHTGGKISYDIPAGERLALLSGSLEK